MLAVNSAKVNQVSMYSLCLAPPRGSSTNARTAGWVVGLTVLQIAVAAAMVLLELSPSLRALHLLVGTAVWVALVALAVHSAGTPAAAEAPDSSDASATQPPSRRAAAASEPSQPSPAALSAVPRPSVARDFITLTKPRIISLLLVTTIAPMFITDHGMPPFDLVLWVAIGGYLMAGGANAINMWFDRDIDQIMTRTRTRPIASGRISPAVGLTFGVTLGAAAFAILWFMANPLTAWLALGGLLFYVFIYTMWLKRSTPQNIVIGGAAGAFPPMIGWAAVTGDISPASVALFAIVFFWTPPHFWALALYRKGDYAKAGVPMLPVVAGVRETKRQMFAYALLLPLAALPAFLGIAGPLYLAGALVLGFTFLARAWAVLRSPDADIGDPALQRPAKRMFDFSIVYLFGLFVLVMLDGGLGLTAPLADLAAGFGE